MDNLIYFDNAATSFPKPKAVYDEVSRCITQYCGNPGRGGHPMSAAAAQMIYDCRCELAEFFGCKSPENVVFTLNTTYALNMVIKGLAHRGDHLLISSVEHNSVCRPVAASGAGYDIYDSTLPTDRLIADMEEKLIPATRMVICNHASNICPVHNPITAIGRWAKRKGLYFVVDGAQSAGFYPINMERSCIDALCIPGHKGLYGIQGCGAVIFSDRFKGERARNIRCLVQGGNGLNSHDRDMPELLPERLEAGTLPTPAIAGLLQGIREIKRIGLSAVREHEYTLFRRMHEMLCHTKGIEVYCPWYDKGNVLLFNAVGMTSARLSDELAVRGVCVRGGYHCSPLGHKTVGTPAHGAVRISFGAFNTMEEVDRAYGILREIIREP